MIHKEILICPSCKGALKFKGAKITCDGCSKKYFIKNKKIYFLKPDTKYKTDDWLDKLKSQFKKHKKLYNFIIKVISPVYSNLDSTVNKWLKSFKCESIVVDIGSGTARFDKNITNLDVFDYKEVDIVADASKLPFKSKSVDGLINIAVLEHVKNPEKFVNEFHRVLKKQGKFFVFIPFLQGYHASPRDYFRWTKEGARDLFDKFDEVNVFVADGPASALLWTFQEWFAITFSFYSKRLYRILLIAAMLVTFPFKFLDIIFKNHPEASNMCSGFYVIGRK